MTRTHKLVLPAVDTTPSPSRGTLAHTVARTPAPTSLSMGPQLPPPRRRLRDRHQRARSLIPPRLVDHSLSRSGNSISAYVTAQLPFMVIRTKKSIYSFSSIHSFCVCRKYTVHRFLLHPDLSNCLPCNRVPISSHRRRRRRTRRRRAKQDSFISERFNTRPNWQNRIPSEPTSSLSHNTTHARYILILRFHSRCSFAPEFSIVAPGSGADGVATPHTGGMYLT